MFGWRWPLIVRIVCSTRTPSYPDSLLRQGCLLAMRINYMRFIDISCSSPVPASAVPDNWCQKWDVAVSGVDGSVCGVSSVLADGWCWQMVSSTCLILTQWCMVLTSLCVM